MIYKTETHLHCAETSPCSSVGGAEFIRRYKEAGYTTVFVTDHYVGSSFNYCVTEEDYKKAIELQYRGYLSAKEEGDRLGVNVILGCEIYLNKCDRLIYGIDESFFYQRVEELTPSELFAQCNEKGYFLIAAHPYRGEMRHDMNDVHGIEVVNASQNHYHRNHNDLALALAEAHPGHLRTSGSDAHFIEDVGCGGIITEEPILSSADYLRILKSGKYTVINNPPQKNN
ncbi:MAG: PHP domain-containing protein [Clostridia bacterium]|nr:PHP domain-containing protein [Clostridia bacterium]